MLSLIYFWWKNLQNRKYGCFRRTNKFLFLFWNGKGWTICRKYQSQLWWFPTLYYWKNADDLTKLLAYVLLGEYEFVYEIVKSELKNGEMEDLKIREKIYTNIWKSIVARKKEIWVYCVNLGEMEVNMEKYYHNTIINRKAISNEYRLAYQEQHQKRKWQ